MIGARAHAMWSWHGRSSDDPRPIWVSLRGHVVSAWKSHLNELAWPASTAPAGATAATIATSVHAASNLPERATAATAARAADGSAPSAMTTRAGVHGTIRR